MWMLLSFACLQFRSNQKWWKYPPAARLMETLHHHNKECPASGVATSQRFFLPLGVSHPLPPPRTATLAGPPQVITFPTTVFAQNLYNLHTAVCLYQRESNFIYKTLFRQRKFTQSVLQTPWKEDGGPSLLTAAHYTPVHSRTFSSINSKGKSAISVRNKKKARNKKNPHTFGLGCVFSREVLIISARRRKSLSYMSN